MAHWAEIDDENKVIRILVGDNDDPNGDEGYQWLIDNLGGRWIKTSFNCFGGVHYLPDHERDENGHRIPSGKPHLRYNYARVGGYYDEEKDAFIPPVPDIELPENAKWILNETTCQWDLAPID